MQNLSDFVPFPDAWKQATTQMIQDVSEMSVDDGVTLAKSVVGWPAEPGKAKKNRRKGVPTQPAYNYATEHMLAMEESARMHRARSGKVGKSYRRRRRAVPVTWESDNVAEAVRLSLLDQGTLSVGLKFHDMNHF